MASFATIQQRYNDLRGEDTSSSADAKGKRQINQAIRDILNKYPFSWNIATTTLTLSSGTASLPATYNPLWHLVDARIVSTGQDTIFTEIPIDARDSYTDADYVYWITQTPAGTFVFNTLTQTGTVTIYYYSIPTDLSGDSDICVVPDGEAVAYLAAAHNWIGDERNVELKREYEQIANQLVQQMYSRDLGFGAMIAKPGISGLNG